MGLICCVNDFILLIVTFVSKGNGCVEKVKLHVRNIRQLAEVSDSDC